jgi:hypothetical protein
MGVCIQLANPTACATWPQVPEPVATKLRTLRRARDDAQSLWRGADDERRAAQDNKLAAAQRLAAIAPSKKTDPWFTLIRVSVRGAWPRSLAMKSG